MIFNPINILFSQNEFHRFDSNGNVIAYTTNTPRDPLVIRWDHITAGNIPLWVDGLGNDPIDSELTIGEAEAAMIYAAGIWHKQSPKFGFNVNGPEGSSSIQIIFSTDPDIFGGDNYNGMNTEAVTRFVGGDQVDTEYLVSDIFIFFNACPDRYNTVINYDNPWKWTADYVWDIDPTPWVDFESVCLHELGHVLGIGHIATNDSHNCGSDVVMQEYLESRKIRLALQPCDITAINYMEDITFQGPGNFPISAKTTFPVISSKTSK